MNRDNHYKPFTEAELTMAQRYYSADDLERAMLIASGWFKTASRRVRSYISTFIYTDEPWDEDKALAHLKSLESPGAD